MNNEDAWWQKGLSVFLKMSSWIAAPVILGAFLGKWLDRKYGSEPWLFLVSIGLAFVFSMIGLFSTALREFQKIDKEGKDKKGKEKDDRRNE